MTTSRLTFRMWSRFVDHSHLVGKTPSEALELQRAARSAWKLMLQNLFEQRWLDVRLTGTSIMRYGADARLECIDPAEFYAQPPPPPEGYVYSWDVASRRLTPDPPAS